MVDIRDIIDGLDNDVDFKNCQKLFNFFKGKEIEPYKHEILDTDKGFDQILTREIGETRNREAIKPIREKLSAWLRSLAIQREKGMFISYIGKNNPDGTTEMEELNIGRKYHEVTGRFLDWLDNPEGKEIGTSSIEQNIKRNYTAKHYALSYLFELDLLGRPVPTSDGGLAQSEIDSYGIINYKKTSFTKAVRDVLCCDRNNEKQLRNISQNWRKIVLELSPIPAKLEAYLKSKGL